MSDRVVTGIRCRLSFRERSFKGGGVMMNAVLAVAACCVVGAPIQCVRIT